MKHHLEDDYQVYSNYAHWANVALSRGYHVFLRIVLGKHETITFNLNFMLGFIESAVRSITKTGGLYDAFP